MKNNGDYWGHYWWFESGALEALYKVTSVLTAEEKDSSGNMHDKGWCLTKAAKKDFTRQISQWFRRNYEDLCELADLGVPWSDMGADLVCSIQHQGTGFWDQFSDDKVIAQRKKDIGKRLDQAAKISYGEEDFLLYVKRGKFCEFVWPLS